MTFVTQNLLGVRIAITDYAGATDTVIAAAHRRSALGVSALAVHGVMTGATNRRHASRLNALDLVVPDGQPVRWAVNLLGGHHLDDRVYGPELMLRLLARCEREELAVYLYGSTSETLGLLTASLQQRFPRLEIVGASPSRFGTTGTDDARRVAAAISASGARLVFVGLGCPLQEQFVYGMRTHLDTPLVAVGAAFDYHAGVLPVPPPWMQRRGLEWLWRLVHDPKRLWKRYLLLNPAYVALVALQYVGLRRPVAVPPATDPDATLPL